VVGKSFTVILRVTPREAKLQFVKVMATRSPGPSLTTGNCPIAGYPRALRCPHSTFEFRLRCVRTSGGRFREPSTPIATSNPCRLDTTLPSNVVRMRVSYRVRDSIAEMEGGQQRSKRRVDHGWWSTLLASSWLFKGRSPSGQGAFVGGGDKILSTRSYRSGRKPSIVTVMSSLRHS